MHEIRLAQLRVLGDHMQDFELAGCRARRADIFRIKIVRILLGAAQQVAW